MPGDKCGKLHVQTLLTAKKNSQSTHESSKEKPPKQKRTHSDVAEDSDSIDLTSIHADLDEIKQSLRDKVTKPDLECLVTKRDLKELVTSIVSQLLESFKENILREVNENVRERTGKLHDKLDSLAIENEELRERIRAKNRTIEILEEKVIDCETRSTEALKLANHNEQYSRKHNIRILNFFEKKDEALDSKFMNLVKDNLGVTVTADEIQAIHRIPGKPGSPRPIIVKLRNTDVKSKIMRKRKELKEGIQFFDDITQRNLGLMTRLRNSKKFESVWFFNNSVYAKTVDGKRLKFDIFDNIEEKLANKGRNK